MQPFGSTDGCKSALTRSVPVLASDNRVWSGHTPVAFRAVGISILSVYAFYVTTTMLAFIYRALVLHDKALLERSLFLLTIHSLSSIVFAVNITARFITTNYPCYINVWLMSGSHMTWMIVFLFYMVRFYLRVHSQRMVAEEVRVNPVTPDNLLEYLTRVQASTNKAFCKEGLEPASHTADEKKHKPRPSLEPIAPWEFQDITAVGSRNSCAANDDRSSHSLELAIPVQQEIGLNANSQRLHRYKPRWAYAYLSDRFYAMCLCIYFVILVGYLALITTLFPRMRISHPYYDCADEAATIPYTAIVGLFNIIIGPAYIIIIWRYKDAYGIRTSMCIIFALGIIIWGLVIAWKATTSLHVRRISSSLPYLVQMTIGHTFFVVIPLYKSVHFARLRKRGLRNAEPATGNSIPMETDISTPASMELSMQAFLELMRTSIGHKKIAEYADACFCPELILFLDVFAAFKGCIYNDLKQKHAMLNADIHTDEAHAQHNAINLGLSVNSGTDTTCSTHNTRISMASTTRHNRISRMFNTGTFASLVKPNEISESISRISARSHNTVSRPNTSENTTDENAHAYLRCIDTGIVETIALAFPSMNITNKTLVPDNLRCHLDAIIKTFILVGSAFEINTTADTILKAKAYLDGDKFDFGTLDSIKIQVLELLYSNVYIRFYQQNQ